MREITVPDQTNKTILITGSKGLAYHTALALAKANATIILAARNVEQAEENAKIIREKSNNNNVIVKYLDLCIFDSIREFAKSYIESGRPLHVLINNAGVMALKDRRVTVDNHEVQFQTNYLGHFLLTHLLLPVLFKTKPSRIVVLSSMAHIMPQASIYMNDLNLVKGYSPWKAYCQSKLACLLFTYEMGERLKNTHVTINAVHPGIVNTALWNDFSGYTIFKGFFYNLFKKLFMISPEDGAKTQIYVATCEECGTKTGGYYSSCSKSFSLNPNSYRKNVIKTLYEKSVEMTGLSDSIEKIEKEINEESEKNKESKKTV